MKKLLTLFLVLTMVSCNDGDFDIPEFEFTDTVYGCGNIDYQILYLKSTADTESMAMTLFNDELGTEEGTKEFPISTSLKVVYRLFDDKITDSYYCQAIPPTIPNVVRELNALSGVVNITTSKVLTDGVLTGYKYVITISDLLFIEGDQRLFFETFYYGSDFEINVDS